MNNPFDLLVDSDAFIGLFVTHDVHYTRARDSFHRFAQTQQKLVTTNLVIAEAASTLSRRFSYHAACQLIEYIKRGSFPLIYVDSTIQEQANDIFLSEKREGTSMVDCVNIAAVRYFNIPTIFGFDRVYTRFGIDMIG
jgi:predicted nucleic acid-binding protein